MSKIMLILTCEIQMINVMQFSLGSGTKNISAIVCICHPCLGSQYSVLLQKNPAAVDGK